jgi:hypothetical protein
LLLEVPGIVPNGSTTTTWTCCPLFTTNTQLVSHIVSVGLAT